MSDRFKFRVFFYDGTDYSTGQMITLEEAFIEGYVYVTDGEFKPTDQCSIIIQSTGLRDKNGVLIYEGDCIHVTYRNGFYFAHICWHKRLRRFIAVFDKDKSDSGKYEQTIDEKEFRDLFNLVGDVEVIGNKYQYPELLETS